MNPIQEAAAAAARGARAQDKKIPFVINISDGRLVPNTRLTRKNQNYRLYRGDVNATHGERMRYLSASGMSQDSATAADDVFELHKATREQLIDFALAEFNVELDPTMHVARMRSRVNELVKGAKGAEELG